MNSSRKWVFALLMVIALMIAAGVWTFDKLLPLHRSVNQTESNQNGINAILVPSESPIRPSVSPAVTPEPTASTPETSYVGRLDLIVPVLGVTRDQLLDTFDAARAVGRIHDAIDIPAPAETPVLAAADGEIVKLFQSARGGTTIYQASSDKKLIFYYAHLSRYADSLVEGKQVRQGETIAYVGDTGNAGAGNYHLHFSIAVVADPKRYWEGTTINPYPLLHR